MNIFVVLFTLLALTAAAPNGGRIESRALELAAMRQLLAFEHEEVHDKFQQYALRYVTAEGIIVSQRGRLVPNIEGDDYVLVTEGEVYAAKFTVGLDGTHVEENNLPVPAVPIVSEATERHKRNPSDTIPKAVPNDLAIIE